AELEDPLSPGLRAFLKQADAETVARDVMALDGEPGKARLVLRESELDPLVWRSLWRGVRWSVPKAWTPSAEATLRPPSTGNPAVGGPTMPKERDAVLGEAARGGLGRGRVASGTRTGR